MGLQTVDLELAAGRLGSGCWKVQRDNNNIKMTWSLRCAPNLLSMCVTKLRTEAAQMLHEQEEAVGWWAGSPQSLEPRQHRKPQETRSVRGACSFGSRAQLCALGLPEQTVLIRGSLKLETPLAWSPLSRRAGWGEKAGLYSVEGQLGGE